MAEREIDRFGCKPSGTFAGWQYGRVLIDDNGNIRHDDVPGEDGFGRQCISDYRKNDRRYADGQLITEFCNLTTHTNFRVYAQNCRPFAYVQRDLNAAKCGYQVPLPTPADPPNPFGTASYGEYKFFNACDIDYVPVEVKIFKRGYNGVSGKIEYAGANPVIVSYKNTDDNKFAPIRACECRLTLVATENFTLQQFYTTDEREFKIVVKKNGVIKFSGFIIPDNSEEEFIAPPYDVLLRATDGLGALKKIAYPVPVGSKVDIKQRFIDIIAYALAMTNLNLDIVTICNLYESKMANSLNDDPLAQASVNPLRMSENGKILDCYTILEKICLQFGAFLVQDNGAWNYVRQSELSNQVIRRRKYNYKALFLFADQFYNSRIASCDSSDISILDQSPSLRIGGAYKRAEVKVQFGDIPTIIFNGDFETWDGQNFNYWTKYGGLNISRIERTIKTTSGTYPTGNYALQFNEIANSDKWLEAIPVFVDYSDKVKLSFNVGNTSPLAGSTATRLNTVFKLRVQIGNYCLTNNGTAYQWVTQLVTVTIPVDNPAGSLDNYTINFDMPAAPISGDMILQLYGFETQQPTQYAPIPVDSFSITKSSDNTDKKVNAQLYISQQDGFYTKTPDQVGLWFGDSVDPQVVDKPATAGYTRPSRATEYQKILNNLYAIYTSDGTFSTGWYEFGGSSASNPIGLMLAKSIMKAYQAPFRFLSSSFLGTNMSYLDVFNVELPNNESFGKRTFALLSGDFNLFTNEVTNANYVEIFSKPSKTIDISVPSYPGDTSPPIIQNPNPSTPTTQGIFTKEFTSEFL